MPYGVFLGSSDKEFNRRVTLKTYEPDPTKLKKKEKIGKWYDPDWHNFWINIVNKKEEDITDEELNRYFPYYRDSVEYSKRCLIAFAHCRTCIKPSTIKRVCPECPYNFEQFIKGPPRYD